MEPSHGGLLEDAAEREPVNLFRVLVTGTALAIPFSFWLQYNEMVVREGLFAVESAVPLPAVTGLVLLVIVRALLKAVGLPRWLSRGEILLVYFFLMITVPLASYGLAQQLLAHLTVGYRHYADPGHSFEAVLHYVPDWIAPHDADHLRALYERGAEGASYAAWVVPMLRWSVLLFAIFCFCLCLNLLIEKQWAAIERLRFPLVIPALELTATPPTRLLDRPLFRDPCLWIGILISIIITGSNVCRGLVPNFPSAPLSIKLAFADPLWRPASLYVSYRPIVLGIAYLAPLNLSLSVWVFQFLNSAQGVLGQAFGLTALRGTELPNSLARFPFHQEQALGAFLFIALASLWLARAHLRTLIRSSFQGPDDADSRTARRAFLGMIASGGIVGLWLLLSGFWCGGAFASFLVILFITVTYVRIRAEAGPPLVQVTPQRPDLMMVSTVGTVAFSHVSLARMSVLGFLSAGYYPALMATQLESLKMARETGVRRRDVIVTLLVALGVGIFAGVWSVLHFWYAEGAGTLLRWPLRAAASSYSAAATHLQYQSGTDRIALPAMAIGFCFTGLLTYLRRSFWCWPIHPLGYAISQTGAIGKMWGMFFLAWLVKSCVMRYGGVKFYRRTVPVFFGIIFGQIAFLGINNLLGLLFDKHSWVSAF